MPAGPGWEGARWLLVVATLSANDRERAATLVLWSLINSREWMKPREQNAQVARVDGTSLHLSHTRHSPTLAASPDAPVCCAPQAETPKHPKPLWLPGFTALLSHQQDRCTLPQGTRASFLPDSREPPQLGLPTPWLGPAHTRRVPSHVPTPFRPSFTSPWWPQMPPNRRQRGWGLAVLSSQRTWPWEGQRNSRSPGTIPRI